MPRKAKKPPRTFADAFKRYDNPKWTYDTSNGHGNVDEWRSAWDQRMGADEAKSTLKGDDPLTILGLTKLPTLDELKSTYRKLMLKHQDWHRQDASDEDQAKLRKIIASYSTLVDKYGK